MIVIDESNKPIYHTVKIYLAAMQNQPIEKINDDEVVNFVIAYIRTGETNLQNKTVETLEKNSTDYKRRLLNKQERIEKLQRHVDSKKVYLESKNKEIQNIISEFQQLIK